MLVFKTFASSIPSCQSRDTNESNGSPGTIFEELGLNYIGPIDGHNLKELKDVISNLKEFEGPQFFMSLQKKGWFRSC